MATTKILTGNFRHETTDELENLPAGHDRQTRGPSLCHLLEVLGMEKVMARIEKALGQI